MGSHGNDDAGGRLELPRLAITQGCPPDTPATRGDSRWEERLDHDGRVCAYTLSTGSGGTLYLPGVAGYTFATGADLVEAFPEPGVSAETITRAYHQIALPMVLQAGECEVLHASAVRDASGVHVFCGASRAGKSTVAYGLSRRGLEVWADDAVAFTVGGGIITTIPLPFALRLRSEVAQFYDERGAGPSTKGKTEALRAQASQPAPIASISLLERTTSAASISRLRPSEALPAVLYHSFYFSLADGPGSVRRRMARQFLDLVASVPIFRVSRRDGLDGLASALDELERRVLAGVSAPQPAAARPAEPSVRPRGAPA